MTYWDDDMQWYSGYQAEIRDDQQYTTVTNLNYDSNNPFFTLEVSQEEYIVDFARKFSYADFSSPPQFTMIEVMFEIYDPTNEEGTKLYDTFRLEVESSGQKATEFCDYS
jgi:hypothetical protein